MKISMLSKSYESSEVDRYRLHAPYGRSSPPAVTQTK